jgi:NADPH:quinone reductase-like Zn-dependent oxidoreductase
MRAHTPGVDLSGTVGGGAGEAEDVDRKVRTMNMYVRSDTTQLAEIVRRIDAGTLTVDVSGRYPLAELAEVHERNAAGDLRGKVVITA